MLSLERISVAFGGVAAIDDVSIEVPDGAIVVLLGPSGCGKSTLLRTVAGLQPPDSGRVMRDGNDITGLAPHERGIGMMFQDHALFPHRDVGQNVEFGLRMMGMEADRRRDRVSEMMQLVGLAGFERRAVGNLSGGEAQRLALARALAPAPSMLLLDEPMGSLDRELRDRLVTELPDVLRSVGISAIHVTHDHDEAFGMADEIVVMGDGRVLQTGPPIDVWERPRSETVARFLGHRNLVDTPRGRAVVLPDAAEIVDAADVIPGSSDTFECVVVANRFRGGSREIEVERGDTGEKLTFLLAGAPPVGDRMFLKLDTRRVSLIG